MVREICRVGRALASRQPKHAAQTYRKTMTLNGPSPPSPITHNLTGGCACGAIAFSYSGLLAGPLGSITLCQCGMCRRLHGFGAAVIPAQASGFTLHQGKDAVREFESSPGKFRAFCALCATPLYSRRTVAPKALRLRIGCLDQLPDSLRIDALTHTKDRPEWCKLLPPPNIFPDTEPSRP